MYLTIKMGMKPKLTIYKKNRRYLNFETEHGVTNEYALVGLVQEETRQDNKMA